MNSGETSADRKDEATPPPSVPGGEMNQRGGRIDIPEKPARHPVDEASEESFPASDAPSTTPPEAPDMLPPLKG